MRLLVGLGNPGAKYRRTRHNIGFDVVDRIASDWGISMSPSNGAVVGDGLVQNARMRIAKPQKYMNRSGLPIRAIMDYYNTDIDDIIVVHDDLELDFGTIKVKSGGGHKGHNGLRDLNKHIGSDYVRVRFGVGRPPAPMDPADFVLAKWRAEETDALDTLISDAASAAISVAKDGVQAAIERVNGDGPRATHKPGRTGADAVES